MDGTSTRPTCEHLTDYIDYSSDLNPEKPALTLCARVNDINVVAKYCSLSLQDELPWRLT